LPGQPFGKAALIRVFGSVVMAAGFCAAGLATADDPAAQRRGLLWFTGGHAVVLLAVFSQQFAIWGPGVGERAAEVLLLVVLVLLYLWAFANGEPVRRVLIGIFDEAPANSTAHLRSQYERQMRHAGAQEERNRLARDLHDSIRWPLGFQVEQALLDSGEAEIHVGLVAFEGVQADQIASGERLESSQDFALHVAHGLRELVYGLVPGSGDVAGELVYGSLLRSDYVAGERVHDSLLGGGEVVEGGGSVFVGWHAAVLLGWQPLFSMILELLTACEAIQTGDRLRRRQRAPLEVDSVSGRSATLPPQGRLVGW
jgi:hypothetical protein